MTHKEVTKHSFTRALKCSACEEVSKDVYKSNKYNKNFCLSCLRETMIDDIRNSHH
jgi:formylmethanofuran dehydrogenase subunit E